MSRVKMIFVYGTILILCIAAFAGYFISNKNRNTPVLQKEQTTDADPASKKDDSIRDNRKAGNKSVKTGGIYESNPLIGVGRGDDFQKTTREAVENAGGLKDIIKKGDVVLIKPNICNFDDVGAPTITDYRVVQTITDMAKEYGASRIIVAEGSIFGNVFEKAEAEQNKYASIKGVELYNFNDCDEKDCYHIKADKSLTNKEIYIPKLYMDADVVISVPKLKTHFLSDAVVSLSLKNSYGVPSLKLYGMADKSGLHELGFFESVVDLNRIRKPDFIVIDGIVGGEGDGPLNNDPVQSKIIFAGKDPVAIDTAAAYFMGYDIKEVPLIERAAIEGLGIGDLSKIRIKGADLNAIKMKFKWII